MKKVIMGWTCSSNRVHETCSVLVRILRSSQSSDDAIERDASEVLCWDRNLIQLSQDRNQ